MKYLSKCFCDIRDPTTFSNACNLIIEVGQHIKDKAKKELR